MTLQISEVFGYDIEDLSAEATEVRTQKQCPFKGSPCTKSSRTNPIGVCSLSNGILASAICPIRFVQKNRIFLDAARLAFGAGARFAFVPEIKILRKANGKKIGKIDYVLARLDNDNNPVDFAALEIQAVYFSGGEIRKPMNFFLQNGQLGPDSSRRPDYRSSAQKRLMPQLSLKVPVFRRWGKKFFIVVDSLFFGELPPFAEVTAANAEVTWLSYPIIKTAGKVGYQLGDPRVIYSLWDDILVALREGVAPEPVEIMEDLRSRVVPQRVLST